MSNLDKYNNWPEESHPSNSKAYFLDSIQINAPKETVWSWLIKPGLFPLWYKLWPKVEMENGVNAQVKKGTLFVATLKGMKSPTLVVDFEPERTLAWTGKKFGIRGYHTWVLQEKAGVTTVVTEETLVGWLPNIWPSPFIKSGHTMHQHWLEQLKKVAEHGPSNGMSEAKIKSVAYGLNS